MKKVLFWVVMTLLVLCMGCAQNRSTVRVTVEACAPPALQHPWAPPAVARLEWQLTDR